MAEKDFRSLVENKRDKEEKGEKAAPRKLNFKIDETLDDYGKPTGNDPQWRNIIYLMG